MTLHIPKRTYAEMANGSRPMSIDVTYKPNNEDEFVMATGWELASGRLRMAIYTTVIFMLLWVIVVIDNS